MSKGSHTEHIRHEQGGGGGGAKGSQTKNINLEQGVTYREHTP